MVAAWQARQFVCTNSDFAIPGWKAVALPDGWTLHHHPDAAVQVLSAAPGAPVLRIGHAFNLDAAGETGAGRYALLKWPEIMPDAGALLALHYGARDGRAVVSSSARLAAQVLDGTPRPIEGSAPLRPCSAFNYIPSPGSPFAGLRKLYHDQTLDLAAFRVLHRPSPIRSLGSYDAALGVVAGELVRFAEELRARIPGTVYLPLTAGLDSRTIAAAFVAAGLPFEAVTLDFRGKPRSDVTVAQAICRRLGVRHRALRLERPDPAAIARIGEHVAGAVLGWDHSDVYPGGGYRYLGAGDAMIVGGCFEIGRQLTGETRFKDIDFDTATGAEVWRRRAGAPGAPAYTGLLDDWIAWRRAHPLEMDFAAAFYLDQRIGGWRAAIEHGYDLLPGLSICPANNPQIYSAMITPAPEAQREGRLQKEAIALLAPELMAFPINPPPLRQRLGRLHRDLVARLRLPRLAPAPSALAQG
jgi:hypothetical protein